MTLRVPLLRVAKLDLTVAKDARTAGPDDAGGVGAEASLVLPPPVGTAGVCDVVLAWRVNVLPAPDWVVLQAAVRLSAAAAAATSVIE